MSDLVASPAARRRSAWNGVFRRALASPVFGLLGLLPALAAALSFSFGWSPALWEAGQTINVIAFALAYVSAWWLAQHYSTLTNSGLVALWSIVAAGAIVVAAFFATRAYYSLSFLGSAFAVGGAWLMIAQQVRSRLIVPTLAMVPGGHVDICDDLEGVRCVPLRRPALRWLRVDGIVADLHARHEDEWSRFIVEQRLTGRPVYHCADVYERFAQKVSIVHLREGDLEQLTPPPYVHLKRVLDLAGAAVGLVLTAPLLLFAALLIKLEDGGEVLFSQERVGFRGRTFRMLKLRSMHPDAERDGPRFAEEDDSRTTRVGAWLRRCRIDELPQLVNVLRGEMSLVGPRPEQVCFVRRFEEELPFYGSRHLVKPGITGWAQIRAGYASDLPETQQKLVHDLYYVKRMSISLDVYILVRTAWIAASGFGAR